MPAAAQGPQGDAKEPKSGCGSFRVELRYTDSYSGKEGRIDLLLLVAKGSLGPGVQGMGVWGSPESGCLTLDKNNIHVNCPGGEDVTSKSIFIPRNGHSLRVQVPKSCEIASVPI